MKTSSRTLSELLAAADAAVVDLDQCIHPRFTQTRCGRGLLAAALRPGSSFSRLRRCRISLLRGALYIAAQRAGRLLGAPRPGNEELMEAFARAIAGVPVSLLEEISARLPTAGPQDWRKALGELGERIPVYLLTFSIVPIARAYGESAWRNRRIFAGWEGTPLSYLDGRVESIPIAPGWLTPAGKLAWLERLLQEKGYRRPLIIGHGRDEAPMARRALEMGGGSVGLRRWGCDGSDFDLLLGCRAWSRLAAALSPAP